MQGRSLAREFGPAGAASGKLLKATAKKKPASQKLANALPADAFDVVLPTSPTAAVADFTDVRDIDSVAVSEDRGVAVTVLFDPDQGLSERIIVEQFTV